MIDPLSTNNSIYDDSLNLIFTTEVYSEPCQISVTELSREVRWKVSGMITVLAKRLHYGCFARSYMCFCILCFLKNLLYWYKIKWTLSDENFPNTVGGGFAFWVKVFPLVKLYFSLTQGSVPLISSNAVVNIDFF